MNSLFNVKYQDPKADEIYMIVYSRLREDNSAEALLGTNRGFFQHIWNWAKETIDNKGFEEARNLAYVIPLKEIIPAV